MDYSRIRDFIISYSHDEFAVLQDIYIRALADMVPVIRRDAADLLRVLILMNRPRKVLEVGTAVGYSACMMASTLSEMYIDYHIDTCEMDESRIAMAESNIRLAGYEDNISILSGDAADTLAAISGVEYDFVFIDAAKAQYMNYLDEAIRLSHPGTVIVTDNILADGDVLESHYLVEKRDRTIHDRMREYIYRLRNDDKLETAILSVADGMAVSIVL